MDKYRPRFGRLAPGPGSTAVGNYRIYHGDVVSVTVQLTMGNLPMVLGKYPYIRLPFKELQISVPWTVFFVARNMQTNEAFNIKGTIRGDCALVDISQDRPFKWTKGDTLFMTTMYKFVGEQ